MFNFRSIILIVAFAMALGTSAQTKKTTTTTKKPATTAAKKSTTTAKKPTTTATKTTTAAKKTTTTAVKKNTTTAAKKPVATTTTAATTSKTSEVKQEYKEGYNEGFEAGLRAAQNIIQNPNADKAKSTPVKKNSSVAKVPVNLETLGMSKLSSRKEEGKNAMFLELQTIFDANGHGSDNHRYEFDFGYLRKSSEFFRTGFGVGMNGDFHFDGNPLKKIPIFWRNQVTIPTNADITPFINMDLGYVFNIMPLEDQDLGRGTIRINPSVGCYFGQAYFGIGYLGEVHPVEHAHFINNVNLKFGLKVGDRPKSYRRFKSSYMTLDMGVGTVFQEAMLAYHNYAESELHPTTFSIFANLAWMFPIGNHFALGPSTGLQFLDTKTAYHNSMEDPDYDENQNLYIPIGVRGEYTLFNENTPIRPYIGADFGLVVGTVNNDFEPLSPTFEIQGGVRINNKYRLGIGFMVNPIESYEYDREGDGQTLTRLNAHFGIDF